MKRFINLLEQIRMIDAETMLLINREDDWDNPAIKELESIFRDFYDVGFENGNLDSNSPYQSRGHEPIDPDTDFANRLSNFYQFDIP